MRIAVIGAGSWGTAAAAHLALLGNDVRIWAKEEEVAAGINRDHRNPLYLTEVDLPENLEACAEIEKALHGSELVVMAVPSRWVGEVAGGMRDFLPPGVPILNLAKGFDQRTGRRLSETIVETSGCGEERVAVLSGPNHAEEVSRRIPSATVIASPNMELAARLQKVFSSPYFRVYTNRDVVGVEIGGAYKNIVAIAAGVLDGLGLGDNTKAGLITRGLAEMTRFGAAQGANPITFSGLSGIGDLIVTCISRHSRNRGFGEQVGRGMRPAEALDATLMVVEGVYAARVAVRKAREVGVEIPIADAVHAVVDGGVDPSTMVERLMTRRLKEETEEDLYRNFLLRE